MDNVLNSKIGTLTREKYNHYYDNNIESQWTPIQPIIKDVRVGKSQSFIITRIQFSIQLTTIKTIYHFQGLSLDELIFDPTNVKKHGLTYTTLSHIRTKKIYFCQLFSNMNFFMWTKNTCRNEQIENNYNLDTIDSSI